jgi:hypothetical protein
MIMSWRLLKIQRLALFPAAKCKYSFQLGIFSKNMRVSVVMCSLRPGYLYRNALLCISLLSMGNQDVRLHGIVCSWVYDDVPKYVLLKDSRKLVIMELTRSADKKSLHDFRILILASRHQFILE